MQAAATNRGLRLYRLVARGHVFGTPLFCRLPATTQTMASTVISKEFVDSIVDFRRSVHSRPETG